jgi:hypothetical protein
MSLQPGSTVFPLLKHKTLVGKPIMFKLTKVFVMYYEFCAWKRNRIAAVLQTGEKDLPDFGRNEREIKKDRKEKEGNINLKLGGTESYITR